MNNVLFGKNNWLFLWQGGQRQFDFLTGISAPKQNSIDNFSNNLVNRSNFCAKKDINYLHVVFPSKPVVMFEFLPDGISENVRSIFDKHYNGSINSDVINKLIYPRSILIDEKGRRQVFIQQDTHMTAAGNVIVVSEILRRLGHSHDPLAFMEASILNYSGDLAKMASIQQTQPETFLFTRQRTEKVWDNRAFLPSNTDNIAIAHNPLSASNQRLLALGDSFLRNCLTPLSTFYRDILYVRSDLFQPELIELFAPDAVITANAERYMCHVRPDSEAESILLRGYGREGYQPSPTFVAALRAQLARRTYPERYHEWAGQVDTLCFGRMGTGEMNNQLDVVPGSPGLLASTGSDPQIVFPYTAIEGGRGYQLHISLHSDASGMAQLFESHAEGTGYPFSEERSHRLPVQTGENMLKFDLRPSRRGRQLRFDPLNCPAKIRIRSIQLLTLTP